MTYQVELTRRARQDANSTVDYLEQFSVAAAERWYAALEMAIESLKQLPQRAGIAPEAEEMGIELRQLLFGKRRAVYRILFTVEGDKVTVWRVRHSAQDSLKPKDL